MGELLDPPRLIRLLDDIPVNSIGYLHMCGEVQAERTDGISDYEFLTRRLGAEGPLKVPPPYFQEH